MCLFQIWFPQCVCPEFANIFEDFYIDVHGRYLPTGVFYLLIFPRVEIRMAIQNGFKIYFQSLVFCSLNVINQGDIGFLLVCGSFRNFYWFVFPEFAGFVIKFGEFAVIITSNMSSLFFFLLLNTNWLHL